MSSKWDALRGTCYECKEKFQKNVLKEYKDHMYCEECLEDVKANERVECSKCNGEFKPREIESYYSKNYCTECLKEEKERRKKEREKKERQEEDKEKDENEDDFDFGAEELAQIYENKVDDKIKEFQKEIDFLKQLILNQSKLKKEEKEEEHVFDYVKDEPDFWDWLKNQSTSNRAVKRFVTHGRKSPIDDGIKIFIKFLKDNKLRLK